MTEALSHYRYRGARALVLLHERHMRHFLETWREAKTANIQLPETDDTDYESLESLLTHLLCAGRGYMTWICEKLNLADPEIEPCPEAHKVAAKADAYMAHLLERWHLPLANVTEERMEAHFTSRWGEEFSIEGMLEHAVMHPIRHEFQLRNLIQAQSHNA